MSDESGVSYAGWFYFVGTFEDYETKPGVTDDFTYDLAHGQNWNVEQYKDLAVSRVEFGNLRLPWIKVPTQLKTSDNG